jgi:LPS sulfotransferase NodH
MSVKICCICHDDIKQGEQYQNPECQHDDFHVGCILQWYRSGERRCPLCNDVGVNEIENISRFPQEFIKIAKRTARKRGANPILKNLCDSLTEKEEDIKYIKQQIKTLKGENGIFGDMLKKQMRLWSKHHRKIYERESIKRSIALIFPIVKLIIVTRKEIDNSNK